MALPRNAESLPFFNLGATKKYQEGMLKNSTSIKEWVELGFDTSVNVQEKQLVVLQRIEKWLEEQLEMNLEWQQSDNEERRERMNALKKMQIDTGARGAKKYEGDKDEKGEGEGGGLFSGAIAKMLGIGAGKLGVRSILGALGGGGTGIANVLKGGGLVAGVGLMLKDSIDVGMAMFDDDLTTEIEGRDLGGLAGGIIGGAIGSVFPGIGTGIGITVGNLVGSYVGDVLAPNLEREFKESAYKLKQEDSALKQQVKILEDQRAQGRISDKTYFEERAKIEAKLSQNERLIEEQQGTQELLDEREKAAKVYEDFLKSQKELEARGGTASYEMLQNVKASKEAYERIDAKFKEETNKIRNAVEEAEKSGLIQRGSWWDKAKSLVGIKSAKIDLSKLSEAKDTELKALMDEGDLDYKSMIAVQNEINKRGGQKTSDPNDAETLISAYRAAIAKKDPDLSYEIKSYVKDTFEGGFANVNKLMNGTLTNADLVLKKEKPTKYKPPQSAIPDIEGEFAVKDFTRAAGAKPITTYDPFGAYDAKDEDEYDSYSYEKSGMKIAGEWVEKDKPLSRNQLLIMKMSMDNGNTYPDWVMKKYNEQTGKSAGTGKATGSASTEEGALGSLSARYESGKRGSAAVGFDRTGGTSYGKYQIATRTGTMDQFMKFLKTENPEAYAALSAAGPADAGKEGKFAQVWKQLAESGQLGDSEHEFIKKTHYDVGAGKLKTTSLSDMLASSPALQDVMWSTAVQHGGSRAAEIFEKSYKEGMSEEELIKRIYAERGSRFGASTESVQASVKKRFADEEKQALAMIGPSSTGSPSGGNAGRNINAESKIQTAMASGSNAPVTVNNNNVNNSQVASVSSATTMPPSVNRSRQTGTRRDFYDPVYV